MYVYCRPIQNCDLPSTTDSPEFLVTLPPTPSSLEKLDSCFSDPESHCESEDFLDETTSELESVKSDLKLDRVDSFTTARPNAQLLAKPMRSFSTQIRSPCLLKRGTDSAKSSIFMHEKTLSRSEEQLWINGKSMTALPDRKQRYSSDAILEEQKPPLPPRTYYSVPGHESQKITSKPLPPIPTDEEEYIPNFEQRRKLSNSMDCLSSPKFEEASPYLSPVDLHLQLMSENQSLMSASSSSHIPDRPPLPALPTESSHYRGSVHIVRSKTQYIPGKKYSHKRSRSSNCDFLKSVPKDEKPYIHQKDGHSLTLNSYATLRPSSFLTRSMRARSGSPNESDSENSFNRKSTYHRTKSLKPSPDNTEEALFGTYTRMSPAPSIDIRSSLCQSQELPRDQSSFHKLPNDSSGTDITEYASTLPPKRGERRKARRWETNKDCRDKTDYNLASKYYWRQRNQTSEGPRYVTHVSPSQHLLNIDMQRLETDDSKRSSCDSNIYEHVDEDVLEDLRKDRNDDYRSSAKTDPVYKSSPQPGVFPHPPNAQEWHYFMYMWRLFLQWMTDHAPPEVYSVPSNLPANNTGNTPPLIVSKSISETYDEIDVRKQSTTSYTSINCDWIKNVANTQTTNLPEEGITANSVFNSQDNTDNTETAAAVVVHKKLSPLSHNSHATLNANGRSISSVDSGICHSQNDDSNSNGDS